MPANENRIARARGWVLAAALAVTSLTSAPLPAGGAEEAGLTFQPSLETALRQAKAEKKVVVVFFSAKWCTWCQKMAITALVDQRVLALGGKMMWVKADIEDDPQLAGAFGVVGVPSMVMLNSDGEVVGSRVGYMTAEQLSTFLREASGKADSVAQATSLPTLVAKMQPALVAATQPADYKAAVAEVVALLARPEPGGKDVLLDGLEKMGSPGWRGLVLCANDERLSIRAAATEALVLATGMDLPLDPFARPEIRQKQAAAWERWIEQNKDRPAGRPMSPIAPTSQPATTQAAQAGWNGPSDARQN